MSVINLTIENFESEVMNSEKPVLIDFWASWCGPCKMMAPVIDEIEKEKGESAKICKVNIDEQSELAEKYGVMSIPTFIVIENGEEKNRKVGAMPKSELIKILE